LFISSWLLEAFSNEDVEIATESFNLSEFMTSEESWAYSGTIRKDVIIKLFLKLDFMRIIIM
jgi:hypothetical protein